MTRSLIVENRSNFKNEDYVLVLGDDTTLKIAPGESVDLEQVSAYAQPKMVKIDPVENSVKPAEPRDGPDRPATGRQPNRMVKWFKRAHLRTEELKEVVDCCRVLAEVMDERLAEGPEKTTGLRKLLEAKDCFVRAEIEGREAG